MNFILILHIFGMILGLGGATYTDLLSFFFAKDFYISRKEADIIKFISKIILVGIAISLVTGVLLFLPEQTRLLESPKFLVKMIAFIVLIINGAFLHSVIMPRLVNFSLKKDKKIGDKQLSLRKVAFVSGAISIVSWYTAFIVAMVRNMTIGFNMLLSIYLGSLLLAVLSALIVERIITKRYEIR